MKKADMYLNMFFMILSVLAFVTGLGYPYSTENGPGPGFFPVWISALLFVFASVNLLLILRSSKDGDMPFFAKPSNRARVAVFFCSILLYIIAVTYLGLLISTLLYAVAVYRLFDHFSWRQTLLPAAGTVAFIYLVFFQLLRLRLPVGFWH